MRTVQRLRRGVAVRELVGAPVVTTVHGKGAFPETHPQCLGMFGMHGAKFANYAVQDSDLIIALGARFDDRVTGKLSTFAPEAKIVHLDVDPAEISKLVTATVPLVGDLKLLLPQLTEEVRKAFAASGRPDIAPWMKKVADWREKHPLRYAAQGDEHIEPQHVIEADLGEDPGQGDRHHRRGRAPDVRGPVLEDHPAPPVHHLRRPRHHGLLPARRHRRAARQARRARHRHRRRRLASR